MRRSLVIVIEAETPVGSGAPHSDLALFRWPDSIGEPLN